MNWNEIKRKALDNGFVFVKHGSRHDEYRNPETGNRVLTRLPYMDNKTE